MSVNRISSRRLVTILALGLAMLLGLASLALACTRTVGQTYWCDTGTTESRSFAFDVTGTDVCAYAEGASANTWYKLTTGRTILHEEQGHACMSLINHISDSVQSDGKGDISPTTGTLTRPGTWQLCFYEEPPSNHGATATGAVIVTHL